MTRPLKRSTSTGTFVLASILLLAAPLAQAARIISIDTDGSNNGSVTYNPDFSFGGDTTTAVASSLQATAFGLPTGDSIYGGDGSSFPDTYVYTYSPLTQTDNLALSAGINLGTGPLSTGLTGGIAGFYNVYAVWPNPSGGVTGGNTSYSITANGVFQTSVSVNQNSVYDQWVYLATIAYSGLGNIVVTQTSSSNTFVSMRAAGMLFERSSTRNPVPEPSTWLLMLSGLAGVAMLRRKVR